MYIFLQAGPLAPFGMMGMVSTIPVKIEMIC